MHRAVNLLVERLLRNCPLCIETMASAGIVLLGVSLLHLWGQPAYDTQTLYHAKLILMGMGAMAIAVPKDNVPGLIFSAAAAFGCFIFGALLAVIPLLLP